MNGETEKITMKQRNELITRMISDKSIFTEINEGKFASELETILSISEHADDPAERLMAISALSRIASVVKAMRADLFECLSETLNNPLPTLQVLENSDDRLYVAKALENTKPSEELITYLFKEVLLEEKGEKAREALLVNLITKSTYARDVFKIGGELAREIADETSLTHDQWLKRYIKIFSILRKSLVKVAIDTSDEAGLALKQFFITTSQIAKDAKDDKSRYKFAEEAIGLIHALIQLRFSLATESETYTVLVSVKNWLGKVDWRDLVNTSDVIPVIRDDLSEAILILAKQGIGDEKLLDYLIRTYPDRKSAEKRLSYIAGRSAAIPLDVKSWLMSGGRHTDLSEEEKSSDAGMLGADQSIALQMLDMIQLEKSLDASENNITESIQMFDPALEPQMQTLFARIRAMQNSVKSLARKRSLRVNGEVGAVVDYSPVDHQLIEGGAVGVRKVRIVSSAIERDINNKVSIVIQAEVEKVD